MQSDNPIATDTDAETHTYRIESTDTGHVFGEYEGTSTHNARDNFASDAGYDDYDDLLEHVPRSQMADIKVRRVDQ